MMHRSSGRQDFDPLDGRELATPSYAIAAPSLLAGGDGCSEEDCSDAAFEAQHRASEMKAPLRPRSGKGGAKQLCAKGMMRRSSGHQGFDLLEGPTTKMPSTADMCKAAIVALKERGGSSRQAIKAWVLTEFKKVQPAAARLHAKIITGLPSPHTPAAAAPAGTRCCRPRAAATATPRGAS